MATYDLTSTTPSKIKTGDILNCPYSGSAKQITLHSGKYKLECWGAQGGGNSSSPGGNGGYSTGIIILNRKQNIYLYTGGAGGNAIAGFNGGGSVPSSSRYISGGGGGASDVRIGSDSLYARIIVAGGGGGGESESTGYYGGAGGGQSGLNGRGFGSYGPGTGGSQTTGGSSAQGGTDNQGMSFSASSFGQGASITGASSSNSGYIGGAGGGGWYGGGAGGAVSGGGGGSGYVYTSSTASNYPSGCLLNSSYYLTDAQTIAGNTAFTSPTGTNETGHTGNGYIRITVIEANSGNTLIKTDSTTWKNYKNMFVNTGASTTVPSGLVELEYIQSSGTQYIDTGLKPTQNYSITIKCQSTGTDSNTYAGCDTNWQNTGFFVGVNVFEFGNASTTSIQNYGENPIVLTLDKTGGYKDGVKTWNNASTQTFQTVSNLTLFALNRNGTIREYLTGKIYYCKIYDNNTLVRDFIPAKRISDGKCGLWDKVNFKFYTDESGGNFTAGAEKTAIAAIGTPLEYIESTGTQYLDTGITVNKSDNKELIMSCQLGNDSSYAGANGYMQYQASITGGAKGILKISYKNNIETIYFNDVLKLTQDWTSAYSGTNVKLGIFKLGETNNIWYNSSAQQIGKLYYYKLYDNGTLIRDFIPVKRISDNEYGLWDKVNKIFYSNAGTGTFTGGPAVTLIGWHKIKGIWAKTATDTWSQAL